MNATQTWQRPKQTLARLSLGVSRTFILVANINGKRQTINSSELNRPRPETVNNIPRRTLVFLFDLAAGVRTQDGNLDPDIQKSILLLEGQGHALNDEQLAVLKNWTSLEITGDDLDTPLSIDRTDISALLDDDEIVRNAVNFYNLNASPSEKNHLDLTDITPELLRRLIDQHVLGRTTPAPV